MSFFDVVKKNLRDVISYNSISVFPFLEKRWRNSEELFVLGSGGSVCDINNWDMVKKSDSVGFNFWVIHDFVPDFFFLETPSSLDRLEVMEKNILENKEKYKNTRIYNKLGGGEPHKRMKRFLKREGVLHQDFSSRNFGAPSCSILREKVLSASDSFFYRNFSFFSQGVASVELIAAWAYFMGYSKLILCGVDLNNVKYFYDDEAYNEKKKMGLVPDSGQSGVVHKTNDINNPLYGLVVSDVLLTYSECFKGEMDIFVESKDSELAKIFPVFPLS